MNKRDMIFVKKKLLQDLEDLLGGGDCNFKGLNDTEENALPETATADQ